jgi:hypothetical protein
MSECLLLLHAPLRTWWAGSQLQQFADESPAAAAARVGSGLFGLTPRLGNTEMRARLGHTCSPATTCAGRLLFFYAATSRCMGLPSLSNGSWERYSGHKIAAVVFFLHKIGSRCKDSPTLSTVQVVKSSYKKSRGDSLLLKSPLAVWSTYSPTTRPWTGSRPVIHAL